MGVILDFKTGKVLGPGSVSSSAKPEPTDPWDTPIGKLLKELSTPSYSGERTPLRREDAAVLIVHLLQARSAPFWDESACRRIRAEVLVRMTRTQEQNDAFVEAKLGASRNREFKAGCRASEAWTDGPLRAFDRALRASYADRRAFLNETRAAYFRAVFALCLVEGNVPQVVPTPAPERERVPAPPVPPRPDRFRR